MSRVSHRRAFVVALILAPSLTVCTSRAPDIFDAVDRNDVQFVKQWLRSGGNPNLKSSRDESLLYIATGPHGGNEVLAVLLEAGANPEIGAYEYSPLMNAASWVDLPAIELLLRYGADPSKRTTRGQSALDVVGMSGGGEAAVIARLKEAIRNPKAPNPALQRTRMRSPLNANR